MDTMEIQTILNAILLVQFTMTQQIINMVSRKLPTNEISL